MERVGGGLFPSFGLLNQQQKNNQNKINVGLKRPPMDGMQSNNQPTAGGSDKLDVGEVVRGGRSEWGNTVPLFGTSNRATQK